MTKYKRGKYKPRARVKGSVRWFMEQGYSNHKARKLAKEYRNIVIKKN